ncbi:hypothetical protein LINPERHAP2_LOCUS39351 [Linum perenne]
MPKSQTKETVVIHLDSVLEGLSGPEGTLESSIKLSTGGEEGNDAEILSMWKNHLLNRLTTSLMISTSLANHFHGHSPTYYSRFLHSSSFNSSPVALAVNVSHSCRLVQRSLFVAMEDENGG